MIHDIDLTQAWMEIERFYDILRTTTISLFGMSISLWALILSEYVACSLLDVFFAWFYTDKFDKSGADDD